MQSAPDLNSWKQHIRAILVQIEGLQAWFEREQHTLSTGICAQLGQIEAELHQLEVEAAPTGSIQHASRMAAQIEALKARGDLAYNLLLAASSRLNQPEASSEYSAAKVTATGHSETECAQAVRREEMT